MHLPRVGKKVRPPRIMHLKFPLGRAFGKAGYIDTQKSILKDLLEFSLKGEAESIVKLDYEWE